MCKGYRWSIAFQFNNDWRSSNLSKSKEINNPPGRFFADPFVLSFNNKNIVFVEDYDYKRTKARISAIQLFDNNTYKYLGVAIEEDYHLSFPFIYKEKNDIFLIPESSEKNEIRMYKCVSFPLEWSLHKVLMRNVSAADTVIFKHNSLYWMFTNIDSSDMNDHNSELHIFYASSFDSDSWKPHSQNPVIFDSTCARNGGLFLSEGEIYRVFQKHGFNAYGEEMGINKVTLLNKSKFKEELVCKLTPDFLKGLKGTHTFSHDMGLIAYDYVRHEKKS